LRLGVRPVSTSHPEGFFALFKPSGLSSAGALRVVKGILSADKAGFLGTLDVPAMGVLPVAVGSATKLISFLPPSEKEYVGELVLGITTITDDMEGEVIERRGATGLEDVVVKEAIESVTAQTEQVPPHVSAKHQDGVRGYKAMRGQGRLIDFAPVPVTVRRFSVLQERQDADLRRIVFRMTVTPGFYVRGFCRDVGAILGCGGCMGRLLRTGAHGFGVSDTLSLATLRRRVQAGDLSFLTWGETDAGLLSTLPQISLNDVQWSAFVHGLAVDCDMGDGTTAMVKCPDGRLGGVAAGRTGKAWPLKVFSE
jgi:tRNA pseudouridine55 synthase